jgi:hypothetical protein
VHDEGTFTESQNLIRSYSLPKTVPIPETMKSDRNCDGCLGAKSMTTLEEQLEAWIVKRCQETASQLQRFNRLNAIFRSIYDDRRFWRYRDSRHPDDYEEALCLMWQYFLRNLCNVTTARESGSFLETRSYAVPRLLKSFKGNLKNIWIKRQEDLKKQVQSVSDENGNPINPVEQLPGREPDPEPEIDPVEVIKIFVKLVEEDSEGELKAEINTLRGIKKSTRETTQEPYTLTAQDYLLMRYRDRKIDQQIAAELDIPRPSLQPRIGKPKRWAALARKLGERALEMVENGGCYDV